MRDSFHEKSSAMGGFQIRRTGIMELPIPLSNPELARRLPRKVAWASDAGHWLPQGAITGI
jgi:hypothetical protein